MSLISEILDGVSKREGRPVTFDDLTEAERNDLIAYDRAISANGLTVDSIKQFVTEQIIYLEKQLEDYKNDRERDLYLKACLRNLRIIKTFIVAPDKQREAAKRELAKTLGISL